MKNDDFIKFGKFLSENCSMKKEKLGFDYYLLSSSYNPNGNITMYYKLVFYKEKLLGASFKFKIPKINTIKYNELAIINNFTIENQLAKKVINYNEVTRPIFGSGLPRGKIIKLMSPFIGTVFGEYCGYGNVLLENRKIFNKIKNELTIKDIKYLLKSINPAVRLLTIEFIYNNQSILGNNEISELIDLIISNMDSVKYCNGSLIYNKKVNKIINDFKKKQ